MKPPELLAGDGAWENDQRCGVENFDYDEIDRRLGNLERGEIQDTGLISFIEWILQPDRTCSIRHRDQPRAKLLIILWAVAPHLSQHESLTALAKANHWPKQKLSQLAVSFRDRFGFISRSMKSESARKAYAARFRDGMLPSNTKVKA